MERVASDPLDIPQFLRRTKPPTRVTRATRKAHRWITTPRKREPDEVLMWVQLGDEAPRIGAGRRCVSVVTEGRKWVTVRYWPGGAGADPIRHRFPLDTWGKVQRGPA